MGSRLNPDFDKQRMLVVRQRTAFAAIRLATRHLSALVAYPPP
jgi:hypothetical protein